MTFGKFFLYYLIAGAIVGVATALIFAGAKSTTTTGSV